jgi:cell division protein FtsI/penicillin-binding protein 2
MKKTTVYKILGAMIVILLSLFSLSQIFKSSKQDQNNNTNPNPAGISIPTQAGEVKVRDFTKQAVEQTKETILAEKNKSFDIAYFKQDQTFLITIEAEPLKQNRDLAEQELLKMLQINEQNACRLKVSVVIPYDVNPDLAGQDYGLSFCPNAKPF